MSIRKTLHRPLYQQVQFLHITYLNFRVLIIWRVWIQLPNNKPKALLLHLQELQLKNRDLKVHLHHQRVRLRDLSLHKFSNSNVWCHLQTFYKHKACHANPRALLQLSSSLQALCLRLRALLRPFRCKRKVRVLQ